MSDGARRRRGYDSLPRSCAGQYHRRRNQQPPVTLSVLGSSRIFRLFRAKHAVCEILNQLRHKDYISTLVTKYEQG